MSTPSKDELKEKYRISNGDFRILTELPPEPEIRAKGFLLKVGEAFGAEEWMWKTWTGILIAIIVIAPQLQSDLDYWTPKVVYSVNQFAEYFRHLQWPLAPSDDEWIAFSPDDALPPDGTRAPQRLPVGTSIVPGSARLTDTVPIQSFPKYAIISANSSWTFRQARSRYPRQRPSARCSRSQRLSRSSEALAVSSTVR